MTGRNRLLFLGFSVLVVLVVAAGCSQVLPSWETDLHLPLADFSEAEDSRFEIDEEFLQDQGLTEEEYEVDEEGLIRLLETYELEGLNLDFLLEDAEGLDVDVETELLQFQVLEDKDFIEENELEIDFREEGFDEVEEISFADVVLEGEVILEQVAFSEAKIIIEFKDLAEEYAVESIYLGSSALEDQYVFPGDEIDGEITDDEEDKLEVDLDGKKLGTEHLNVIGIEFNENISDKEESKIALNYEFEQLTEVVLDFDEGVSLETIREKTSDNDGDNSEDDFDLVLLREEIQDLDIPEELSDVQFKDLVFKLAADPPQNLELDLPLVVEKMEAGADEFEVLDTIEFGENVFTDSVLDFILQGTGELRIKVDEKAELSGSGVKIKEDSIIELEGNMELGLSFDFGEEGAVHKIAEEIAEPLGEDEAELITGGTANVRLYLNDFSHKFDFLPRIEIYLGKGYEESNEQDCELFTEENRVGVLEFEKGEHFDEDYVLKLDTSDALKLQEEEVYIGLKLSLKGERSLKLGDYLKPGRISAALRVRVNQ